MSDYTVRRFETEDAEEVAALIRKTIQITNAKDYAEESSLFTIFVLPEYQGKGVGRKIIAVLEQYEFFLRAKRVEIPASITACEFYKKMGYTYKNGIDVVDEEQLYRLEKFR